MSELGKLLISIVRQRAADNPSFVYPRPRHSETGRFASCEYVHADGTPGCIVGHALLEAEVIDPSFTDSDSNVSPFNALTMELILELDIDEVEWLRSVQMRQDQGYPWGESVLRTDTNKSGWSW